MGRKTPQIRGGKSVPHESASSWEHRDPPSHAMTMFILPKLAAHKARTNTKLYATYLN
jgi:hypothetical protein